MSITKIGFLTHYKPTKPDPVPETPDKYARAKAKAVEKASWMSMSGLSCRDFSKNTYNYRDKHFVLAEEGQTFPLPSHLNQIYVRSSSFQKSEFRKLPLKPGKLQNSNKKVFHEMRVTSAETFTHIDRS